jgi:hypothetical protein
MKLTKQEKKELLFVFKAGLKGFIFITSVCILFILITKI